MHEAWAAAALVREAAKHVGVIEQPPNSNRGPQIDYWLQQVDAPLGSPWCAAFVWAMGRQAIGPAWPVARTGSVQAIVDWADTFNVIHDEPRVGDLVVLYFKSLKRYAHIGIVSHVASDGATQYVRTIEGNTNPGGSREGYGVFRRVRTNGPTVKFLRWASVIPAG